MGVDELELERLELVASHVRDFVVERDNGCCRICGRPAEVDGHFALHHIVFRSHGGLDVPSNLITIGDAPWHDCHHRFPHGRDARIWRPILLAIADRPAITGLQARRWQAIAPPPRDPSGRGT